MRIPFKIGAAIGVLVLSGCVVAPYHPRAYGGYGGYGDDIVVDVAPPPPYVEVTPALPYAGAIWIDGYWGWSAGRHRWAPGYYERARPGYAWAPRHWERERGRWHLRGGGWRRGTR